MESLEAIVQIERCHVTSMVIPTSETHITHTKNLKADGLDTRKTTTEYDFGGSRKLQEHSGHKFPDDGSYDTAHVNKNGKGGIKGHYEYKKDE